MAPISILYIIDTFNVYAGTERNLFELVMRIDKKRFTPVMVVLHDTALINEVRDKGIIAYNLNLTRIYTLPALIKAMFILKLIKQHAITVMVTYHESSDFLGSILARLAGVPVVISSRRDMGYKLKKRHILFYRLINRFFTRIITVSDAVKNIIFVQEHTPLHRLVTVYNGIDPRQFSAATDIAATRTSAGLINPWPVISIIAAIRRVKGHRYFIEAAARVLQELPHVYFLIVGWFDEENEYMNELKELIRRYNLEKNVIFTNGRSDIPAILAVSDISVISSLNEGFSNTIIESMAAGKPVIGTASGGTSEAIIDGVTGILVPPQDSAALAEAMLVLLKDSDRAASYGAAGRSRAREFFTIDRMIRQIELLYERLLHERDARNRESGYSLSVLLILKRAVKHIVSSALWHGKLISVRERLRFERTSFLALAYHRVNDDSFDPLFLNVGIADFERQMRLLRAAYCPISLDEAIACMREERRLPAGAMVVTFDDGYRDNYENALPILMKYRIPATLFITAGAVDKQQLLWYDRIVSAVEGTQQRSIDLRRFELSAYPLGTTHAKIRAVREMVARIKQLPGLKRDEIVAYIARELGDHFHPAERGYDTVLLSWAEVSQLHREGIAIGSHGMTHTIMTAIPPEDAEQEIAASKLLIKEQTGIDTEWYSYPNGGREDFNSTIITILKNNGYRAACSLIPGRSNDNNLYAIPRLCVTRGTYINSLGRYSDAVFAAHLSGFFT